MTPTIALILLSCLLPLVPSQLRVNLIFSGLPMRARVASSAMHEVRRIWSVYGVDVRDVKPDQAAPDSTVTVSITLVDGDSGALHTLGTTQFVDGRPLPSIVIYPNAIAALLSSEYLVVRECIRWSVSCQDLLNGRVLGRALAHELGHYLLRARGHSSAGLMRAQPPAAALIDDDSRGFGLTADQARQLALVRRQPCR